MLRPPDPRLLGFLEAFDPVIADMALALREIILDEAPGAAELVYQVDVSMWFGFNEKSTGLFCYVSAHTKHVNLGFPYGATLADPNRVLIGEGKTMRHIKFASSRDVERAFVRRYIRAAIDQAGEPAGGQIGQSIIHTAKKSFGKKAPRKSSAKRV